MGALLFWVVVALVALFLIGLLAGFFAAVGSFLLLAGAVIAAAMGVTFAIYLVGRPLLWDIRNRGGDRLEPDEYTNSYRQYLAGPVYRGFLFSLQEARESGAGWLTGYLWPGLRRLAYRPWLVMSPVRDPAGSPPDTVTPRAVGRLGWGQRIGLLFARIAVLGALIGAVLGVSVAIAVLVLVLAVGTVVCGAVMGASLLIGWGLGTIERLRMKSAGAGYLCPECGETAELPVYLCSNPDCGAAHQDLLPGPFGVFRQRCRCDQTALPTLRSNGRGELPAICPNPGCRAGLSAQLGELRNIGISIAGGTAAGKTSLCVGALESLARLNSEGLLSASLEGPSAVQFASMVTDLGRGQEPKSTGLDAPAILLRLASQTGPGALVFIHDVAGELYGETERLRTQSVFSAFKGAVLVVDPFSVDAFRAEYEAEVTAIADGVRPSSEPVDDAYGRLVEALTLRGESLRGVPLAVALTKTDALPAGAEVSSQDGVRGWLTRFGLSNLVLAAENDFGEVSYFSTSGLGSIPGSVAEFEPGGALELFSWLLGKEGIALPTLPARTSHVDGSQLLSSPEASKPSPDAGGAVAARSTPGGQQGWEKFKVSNPGVHSAHYGRPPATPPRALLGSAAVVACLLGLLAYVPINDQLSTSPQERAQQQEEAAATARAQKASENEAVREELVGSWQGSVKQRGSRVRYRLTLPRSDGRLQGAFRVTSGGRVVCEAQVDERRIRSKSIRVQGDSFSRVEQVVAASRVGSGRRSGPCRTGNIGFFVIPGQWEEAGDLSYGGRPAKPKQGDVLLRRAN